MTSPRGMMGFDNPGDQKVLVRVRDWNAVKLALWRSKESGKIIERSVLEILARCQHLEECPGEKIETEPCLRECPDREVRMSALVVLNAVRTGLPKDANKPAEGTYFAPSRELYSEMLVDWETTKMENVALREALRRANVVMPVPGEELTPKELVATTEPRLEEKTL